MAVNEPQENKESVFGQNITLILFIILAILVLLIAAVIIHDASDIFSLLGQHLLRLFENAGLNPNNPNKFGNFVELILIAGFVGWAWKRFKRK